MPAESKPTVEFVYDTQVVDGKKVSVTWAEVRVDKGAECPIFIFAYKPCHRNSINGWLYVHSVGARDIDCIDPFLPKWGGRALDRVLSDTIVKEAKQVMKNFATNRKVLKKVVTHVSGREAGILWTRGYEVLIDLTDQERGVEVIAVGPALHEWRDSELRQYTPQLDREPRIGDTPNLEMLQWRER